MVRFESGWGLPRRKLHQFRHTYHLHPLECITTICNSSPTLHPRGVNNTSPALGGVSAECICKLELQPSLYNCSRASCNCRQFSAIAAEHCSAAIADCRQIRSFGVFAMERQHCSSSQVPICCRCCNCVAVQLTPTRSTTSLSTHYQNYSATSIKHEHHMLRCGAVK